MTNIDEKLLKAYADALYRIESELDFKVGTYSAGLRALHDAHGARHSHFITAFNPRSQRLTDAQNAARHAELGRRLDELGAKRLAAAGLDPQGGWPLEPGYLVFDLSPETALELGRAYGQNALVGIGPDAIPRLILIDRPGDAA